MGNKAIDEEKNELTADVTPNEAFVAGNDKVPMSASKKIILRILHFIKTLIYFANACNCNDL